MIEFREKYKMSQEVKKYVCICGKEFDNPQAFNSHKGSCKIHLTQKYGSYEKYLEIHNKNHENVSIKNSQQSKEKKIQKLTLWVSEKHACEKCGKVMTEKYGSGRFCCRSCANSHQKSEQTKNKISIKARKNREVIKSKQLELQKKSYYSNPKKCVICNNIIPFEHKNRKTCCETCYKKHLSKIAKKNKLGGITKGHGTGRGGNYKNIHCDSKYELIFLVYCIELNMNIERNFTFFIYTDKDNKQHKYYPDFYFPDLDMFIEIKGYFQENTKYKIKAMAEQGIKHKVLYWEDLKPCLALIKEKFNLSYNSVHKLYN